MNTRKMLLVDADAAKRTTHIVAVHFGSEDKDWNHLVRALTPQSEGGEAIPVTEHASPFDNVTELHRALGNIGRERDVLRAALWALVEAWEASEAHIDGAIQVAALHGFAYAGPGDRLGAALAKAKEVLGD